MGSHEAAPGGRGGRGPLAEWEGTWSVGLTVCVLAFLLKCASGFRLGLVRCSLTFSQTFISSLTPELQAGGLSTSQITCHRWEDRVKPLGAESPPPAQARRWQTVGGPVAGSGRPPSRPGRGGQAWEEPAPCQDRGAPSPWLSWLIAKPDCRARADVAPAALRCRGLLSFPWSSRSSLGKALAPVLTAVPLANTVAAAAARPVTAQPLKRTGHRQSPSCRCAGEDVASLFRSAKRCPHANSGRRPGWGTGPMEADRRPLGAASAGTWPGTSTLGLSSSRMFLADAERAA